MFRKIICLIVVVFTLLSVFTASASAVITYESGVMADLSTLKVDGVPFSEEGYPVKKEDDNMYVLAVVEQGFSSSSSSLNFDFYIYLYNPSCVNVVDDPFNAVQANCIDDCKTEKYTYYGLKLIDKSDDSRFLKLRVYQNGLYKTPVENLYKSQKNDHERIYHIVSVRLFAGNEDKTFVLDKSFTFSGFGDSLSCYSEELGSIQVEMFPTNWISPNAGYKKDKTAATIYDHYEINSVYFTLPRSYVDGSTYDAIKYIGAAFDAYRTTPIIVTAPSYFDSDKGQVTKKAIEDAVILTHEDIDVFDLVAFDDSWMLNGIGVYKPAWIYSERYNLNVDILEVGGQPYNTLAYYFENDDLEGYDFFKANNSVIGFTSEEFAAYFNERYNDPNYDNKNLYTKHEYVEKDYWLEDFKTDAFYEMGTYFSSEDSKKWYRKLTTRSDSYLYENFETHASHVQLIKNPSEYVSVIDPKAVANKLFISQYDVDHFSELCKKAVANDEVVVLLRFGFGDYSCAPVVDLWEIGTFAGKPVGMAIEKWVYFDVNLLHVAFSKNKQTIVVPVVSNTVDAPGDGVIFPDPNGSLGDLLGGNTGDPRDDNDDWLKKILMIIGIVLLVAALGFLVKIAFEIFGKKQKIHIAYGPPPEEKKQKKKRFRR